MTKRKIDTLIQLARYHDENGIKKTITIEQYNDFLDKQDRDSIAEMIYHRLHSRYLKPFLFNNHQFKKEFKNGFSIMANCCLLIETFQSFKNGWGDSNGKSGRAFREFFGTDENFIELRSKGKAFFENIRCGILHQGETTNGWRIARNKKKLVDGKTIDSILFLDKLEKSLIDYREGLKTAKWDSELWDNARTKLRKVIFNCIEV